MGVKVVVMTGKRRYDEGCAAAHALDLVGERWALLIARELLFGPKRFTDLRSGIPNASPNVLSQRLRELEEVGVVGRRTLAPPAASQVYELTTWGRELEPVIIALGRWGGRSPLMQHDAPLSIDALMLALKTMFSPDLASGFTADFTLRLDEASFRIHISDRQISITRTHEQMGTIIETNADTLDALICKRHTLKKALKTADVRLQGDQEKVARFLDLFPLPQPAKAD